MSSCKLLLLGLLAACALSATMSSSASASTCSGGTNWVFCDSSNNELQGGTLYLGLFGLSLLISVIGGQSVDLHCLDVHDHGLFLPRGRVHGVLTPLFCREIRPSKCKLSSADEKELRLEYELELTSATTALLSGFGSGETFGNIEIEGSECGISGTYVLTGQQTVELPEGEVSKAEHELVVKKIGSKLKLGGEAASLSSSGSDMLGSGGAWLTMLSA